VGVASRYYEVERQVMVGRARGTLAEAREDELLEESDELWLAMTDAERAEVDARVREYVTADAPASLGMVDLPVDVGQGDMPRAAA
jgi:hypothetical protein